MRASKIAMFVAAAMFSTSAVNATETSSGIRGKVIDTNGMPQANVTVEVVHQPTNTVKVLTTSEGGVFQARGMNVGGPYLIRLQDGSEFTAKNIEDLYLKLSKTASVSLVVKPKDYSNVETISVTGSLAAANTYKQGASTDFSSDQINNTAAISRDLKSVLQSDSKIMVDNTVDGGPAMSVAGANVRFNSLTVDGVKQNDDFGLNKNGYPTRRSPISLDAIEQLSVNVAPFDVTYGDFQGGNVNVVTKSGTNELSGTVFMYKSNDSLIGDKSEGEDVNIGDFDEDTYGFSLGGALIEDELFFFASYEKFEATSPFPMSLDNGNGVADPNEITGVTQDDIARITEIASRVYNYDTMGFDRDNEEEDEKLLLKLDWFINDDHRASLTYQTNEGNSIRDFWSNTFTQSAATVSDRYNHTDELTTYSLQLFSDWNDDFSTEFKVLYKDVTTSQVSLGEDFAQMKIATADGGSVYIGPDQFRHANELDNQRLNIAFKGNYYLNDEHNLTFGYERDTLDVYNLFVFGSKGWSEYVSIDAFENMDPVVALYQNAPSNNARDAADEFTYNTDVLYFQDEWSVTDDLTVTAGLRYTKYSNNDKPELNQHFVDRHGYANTENFDGLDLLSPRVGFNYQYSDNTVVRGGFGLFGGGIPNVWLSNSYGNDGLRKHVIFGLAQNYGGWVDLEGFNGRDIPQYYIDNLPAGDSDTNSIDPNFEIPSTWKYNLAVEHTADLTSIGLGDYWHFTAELIHNEVNDAAIYRELNLEKVADAPDGRPVYNSVAPFDLSLTNTGKGKSTIFSLDAAKNFDTEYGTFDLALGYTHQDSEEVNPGNAFVAFEGYAQPASSDFQDDKVYTSEYEVPHRFTASLTWQKELFGDNLTTVSLLYIARSGRHFSYTMDHPNGEFGGLVDFANWDAYDSQLLYVPTGVNDPLVNFADAAEAQAFNDFIEGESCLRGQRGQIADRHSCSSSWRHTIDLHVAQEVKITEEQSVEFYLDIENLGNLINDDWGRAEQYPYWYVAPVVTADINEETGQYDYSNFNIPAKQVSKVPSVWKAQVGVRYRF